MENTELQFSSILNYQGNYASKCRSQKTFQVLDSLETQMKSQADDVSTTHDSENVDHHAINVQEICGTDAPYETKQEQSSFSNLVACGEVIDLGIDLREKSSRNKTEVPERAYNRQSSIINLKEDKKRLLNENFEYLFSVKESIEVKRDLAEPPDTERWKHSNLRTDEGFVKQELQHEEGKFGEQPHSLNEDEFVNLAISQTKADVIRQETIHLHEHQVIYEEDFVSLRSSNIKGPTKVEIGRGTYGKCFQVEYATNTGRTIHVVLKEIENNTYNTDDKRRNEYLMLKRLDHPNIVRSYWEAMDPITKKYTIAMEYMSGGSVSNYLQLRGEGFDENLIKHYTVQLLQGLAYLHSINILHRDIKGENLLLCKLFKGLKICDFGCATRVDCIDNGYTDTQLIGTVPFMAPEIVSKYDYSAASDVWSVGCCIIQMATGQLPWNANRNEECAVLYKIGMATDPQPIPEYLSTALQNLTQHCLFIDKKKRLSAKVLQQRFQKAFFDKKG